MLAYLLIAVGIALLLLDLRYPGLGIPSIGAFALLAAGAVMLGSMRVLVPLLAAFGAFTVFSTVVAVRRVARAQTARWTEQVIGRQAVVRAALAPEGVVTVRGERWPARIAHGTALPGEQVWVIGAVGSVLEVAKEPQPAGLREL